MSDPVQVGRMVRELVAPFLVLDDAKTQAIQAHYDRLVLWNKRLNLTRLTIPQEVARFHYGESLFAAVHLETAWTSCVDLGSGAGFPGFPVAVAKPGVEVTLVESHQRKAAFLREVSDLVPNLRVVAARGEDLGGQWDVLLSRAVRVQDVLAVARRVAGSVALLVGEEDAEVLQCQVPASRCLGLPWGDKRFLVLGKLH